MMQEDAESFKQNVQEGDEASDAWHGWDVSDPQDDARALSVGEDGVFVLFTNEGASQLTPWEEVEDFSFPTAFQLNLKVQGRDPQMLTLTRSRHRREIATAVPPAVRERFDLDELQLASTSMPRFGVPQASGSAFVGSSASVGNPATALWRFFWIGLGLQVLGGVFIGRSWPTASYDDELGGIVEDGSTGWLVTGWLMGGAGTLVMFVALIGFGTMLGIRAARTRA